MACARGTPSRLRRRRPLRRGPVHTGAPRRAVAHRQKPERWSPTLQDLCAQAGVAVAIVDTYTGARANRATRWLAPAKALIQLSLRHRWEDIFWFSFFHEAGHVVLHRKKDLYNDLFVEEPGQPTEPSEQPFEDEADRFAARTLVPPPHDRRLAQLSPNDIQDFARKLDIAPAIIVGRMQHDGVLPYNHGNKQRRRLEFAG